MMVWYPSRYRHYGQREQSHRKEGLDQHTMFARNNMPTDSRTPEAGGVDPPVMVRLKG